MLIFYKDEHHSFLVSLMPSSTKNPSSLLVIIAFAIVYIVWGSTYFFIQMAVHGMPPMLLGAIRFVIAGLLMMLWCLYKGEDLTFKPETVHTLISGFLILFVGNGAVIWVEQKLPSAMVAILVSAAPIWFVLLDRPQWAQNFKNKFTITGLIIGFAGVILLFGEQLNKAIALHKVSAQIGGMAIVLVGSVCWSGGSLYSKYKGPNKSAVVNTAWQMLAAGLVFLPLSFITGEAQQVNWSTIPANAWLALLYLIIFGSIAAYSAYVWLLQVRPATQVSTYAYINPVIAVILGVFFAGESISIMQVTGLIIILASVLLINLAKYRQEQQLKKTVFA
jgi:drug/metabolite transporter (DMT)-like permease